VKDTKGNTYLKSDANGAEKGEYSKTPYMTEVA